MAEKSLTQSQIVDQLATSTGLTKVQVKGVDLVYRREGVSMAPYNSGETRFMLMRRVFFTVVTSAPQRVGGCRRTVALMRFHAFMVTAIAITCPSSRSENTSAARWYTASGT